ncbi:hypothetical protein KCU81_g666, partial [Aureobasidium melanogenum]
MRKILNIMSMMLLLRRVLGTPTKLAAPLNECWASVAGADIRLSSRVCLACCLATVALAIDSDVLIRFSVDSK